MAIFFSSLNLSCSHFVHDGLGCSWFCAAPAVFSGRMWLLSHPWCPLSIHAGTYAAWCSMSGPSLGFLICFNARWFHGTVRNPKASMTGAMCWIRLDDLRQCELRLSLRSNNSSYDCPHDQLLLPCEDRLNSSHSTSPMIVKI